MDKILTITMEQGVLLIQLIIAHIIADFALQSDKMAKDKKWFNREMLMHISIVFMLAFILSKSWLLALVVAILHYVTDGIKKYFENKTWTVEKKISQIKLFSFDQLAHLLEILLVWILFSKIDSKTLLKVYELFSDFNFVLILVGYLIAISPVGLSGWLCYKIL
jgi:uncharacterized membrane protein